MRCIGRTEIGLKRRNNQDCFKIYTSKRYITAVVCDGMGGANGGSLASSLAANAFIKSIRGSFANKNLKKFNRRDFESALITAVTDANTLVHTRASEDISVEGMGTTLVAFVVAENETYCVNIGDSRMYIIKNCRLEQITHDHSFVQFLVDNGTITPAEAIKHPNKNILLKVVGVNEHADCDVFKINDYDYILLCSDGLTNMLTDNEIQEIINKNINLDDKTEELIQEANNNGGLDNITAVLYDRKGLING